MTGLAFHGGAELWRTALIHPPLQCRTLPSEQRSSSPEPP